MKKHSKSVLHNPIFWSGTLAGCLLAVLTLASVNVYAQSGGDFPSEGAPPEVTSTPSNQSGDGSGNKPSSSPWQDLPAEASQSPQIGADLPMFMASDDATQATTANISTAITYQGVLKDNNNPANGSYDFRFRLFDDPDAGNQMGEQLIDTVAVQDGQFTTLLDFGQDAFSNQAVWLEIAVRPAGGAAYEALNPRQAITAAPLALGLPNLSTDPTTGYVSVGGGSRISSFQQFGIKEDIDGWVGMYISGGGDSARPYYGYSTNDEGSYEWAWTEYNGGADEWQLYTIQGNVFSVSNNGDLRQPAAADGLVKAAAQVECWGDPNFLTVYSSFNSVTGLPVTAATGPTSGECYVDFGFSLTNRFYSATALISGAPRGVTCEIDPGNSNRLLCMRWRPTDLGAESWGGRIMVLIY